MEWGFFSAALHKYDMPDAGLRARLTATPQRTHLSDGSAEPLMAIAIGCPRRPVQSSLQGLLENGNVLLQRCVQEANAAAPCSVL